MYFQEQPANSVCNPLGYTKRNRMATGVHAMHVYTQELALVSAHKSPSSFCRFGVTGWCFCFSNKLNPLTNIQSLLPITYYESYALGLYMVLGVYTYTISILSKIICLADCSFGAMTLTLYAHLIIRAFVCCIRTGE